MTHGKYEDQPGHTGTRHHIDEAMGGHEHDTPNAHELRPGLGLPIADKERKALPIFDGVVKYFPDALLSVAEVSRIGNDQHNPGEPLHWDKEKSTDQVNTEMRHKMDHHCFGKRYDTDGARHLAKAAWRALADLQLDIAAERRGE